MRWAVAKMRSISGRATGSGKKARQLWRSESNACKAGACPKRSAYSAQFKLQVLSHQDREQLSSRQVAAVYDIRNPNQVVVWRRKLDEGGVEPQIERTVDAIRDINRRAINIFVLASSFGSALFFMLIALILSWAPWQPTDPVVLSGFVLILLFIKGPMDQIIGAMPRLGRARVAFGRIAGLSARFATPEPHLRLDSAVTSQPLCEPIELRGVRYAFEAPEGGESFVLGPVDLKISRGEIAFIVGDNGSGKTTLIKLLLGLYAPQQGELMLDGKLVKPETRDDYRQLFTTVFPTSISSKISWSERRAGNRRCPRPPCPTCSGSKLLIRCR